MVTRTVANTSIQLQMSVTQMMSCSISAAYLRCRGSGVRRNNRKKKEYERNTMEVMVLLLQLSLLVLFIYFFVMLYDRIEFSVLTVFFFMHPPWPFPLLFHQMDASEALC